MASEWDLQNPGEVVLGIRDINGHVGKRIDGLEGMHGGYWNGQKKCRGKKTT